uniref:Tenascin XB n=1 Tax=Myripristis murdjan TaxID=586833 RepID=A0A667XKT5_9TELE
CPNECSDQGRCVDGKGRCVNGQCVCDPAFTGPDCSESACPDNCNNRGKCVDGQCVCNPGFTGPDCSAKACPNNCSNRGKCVNGKCVCDVGFAGPDCAGKGCPNNCNNKGRCVKGKCVCRRGFTGPDCSQCEAGMTGPNCDTGESNPPKYTIKTSLYINPHPLMSKIDQQITVQVEGSLTTFTQTGLAAGQEYTVTVTGEIDGRMGAESSTEFITRELFLFIFPLLSEGRVILFFFCFFFSFFLLNHSVISGPTNLEVVKTTTTSTVVQWEQSQGEIDRYRLTVSPNDGVGRSQEITVPSGRDSAQIAQLEAGRLYDIILVAEKGSRSGRDGEGPRDLQASQVTPRTALLTWKPPSTAVGSYRLTYQAEGQEMKVRCEVIVDATATEYKLSRLHPGSRYTVQLQGESGGRYTAAVSTEFTTGSLRFPFPTDCSQELLNGITESGEAEIFLHGQDGTPLPVYCDMETDGGGWTVFQRRKDGSEDFFRKWKEYVKGFGNRSGEFWLGLDAIHNLTAMTRMSLRVDLRAANDSAFAKYSTFEVGRKNYKLTVGGYSGTAGDSMSYHNTRPFSTKDRDLMPFITRCAMSYRGGWWYKNCHEANLNGRYGVDVQHQGIIWTTWKGKEFSIPFAEMKMRPAAFYPPSRG